VLISRTLIFGTGKALNSLTLCLLLDRYKSLWGRCITRPSLSNRISFSLLLMCLELSIRPGCSCLLDTYATFRRSGTCSRRHEINIPKSSGLTDQNQGPLSPRARKLNGLWSQQKISSMNQSALFLRISLWRHGQSYTKDLCLWNSDHLRPC